ncbi:hypothetical protein ACFQ22_00660 [Lentilactobacillus raoultii]|uniref:Sap-like sulfolipid-1-addressing protein n=1 Tax=Lentilactobacillus raoultii TaxID=1987503 RepID=A0ABW3PBG6_9LACO|nr:hypothetical protein [Lentilactobacillus raoultii]
MVTLFIIIGLASLDSLNPSAILMTYAILGFSKNYKKLRNLFSYAFGMMLTEFLIGSIAVFGMLSIINHFLANDVQTIDKKLGQLWHSSISWWLLLGLSTIIFIILLKHSDNRNKVALIDKFSKNITDKGYYFVLLGIMITFVEFSTAMPYLGAISLLIALKQNFLLKTGYLGLYAFIYVLPEILIIGLYFFKREMINNLSQKYFMQFLNTVTTNAGTIFKILLSVLAALGFIIATWHLV